MDKIFQKQLEALNYMAPEELLREVMPLVEGILQKPETVRHLSQRERNAILEKHQAGYLALLTRRNCERLGVKIEVACKEIADCDSVIRAVDSVRGTVYKPVQLKQLPPEKTSPDATLQGIIDRLKAKYRDPSNLIVAVWINRGIKFSFEDLDFAGLNIEQLWFFGDAATGDLTLDGGQIRDLIKGCRWSSRLKGSNLKIDSVRFKPLQPA